MSFEFLNGKFFDISKLKAGFKINPDNVLLKKYDKNNNSIFDSSELEELRYDLEPYLEDGRIDEREAEQISLKIIGIKEKAVSLLGATFEELSYEQAKQISVETLSDEVDTALGTFFIAKRGPASSIANFVKELFNTKYAASNVYRTLLKKKVSAELLDRAKNSDMSAQTYLKAKTDLFTFLLGGENGEPNEKKIKAYLKYITPSEMNAYINDLASASDEEYEGVRSHIIGEIEYKMSSEFNGIKPIVSVDSILNNPELANKYSDKMLTFEDIFYLEYGVNFDKNKVTEYENKKQELQFVMLAKNRITEAISNLKVSYAPLENVVMQDTPNYLQFIENNTKALKCTIVNTLQNLCGKDETAINNYIKKIGFDNIKIENNELIFSDIVVFNETPLLVDLAKAIETDLNESYQNNILNGRQEEDLIKGLDEAHADAYGKSNPINLAGEFAQSQEEGATYVKLAMEAGIAVAAVVTGGAAAAGSALVTTIVTASGIVLSVGSGAAIDAMEAKAKYGEISEEKKQEILEELKLNGILTLASLPIGGVAGHIGQVASKSCPKLLGTLARIVGEYGSDLVMSCLVDYAITGELNLSCETIGELMNMAVGIAAHKNIRNAVHTEKNPKTSVHENKPKIKIGDTAKAKKAKTFAEYKKILAGGKNLIDMTDTELTQYYKALVPDISDNELKCLIEQMHRIKNGEPRFLGTKEEYRILYNVKQKMLENPDIKNYPDKPAHIGQGLKPYDSDIHKPADIEFKPKELNQEQRRNLMEWYKDGINKSMDEVYDDLGTTLEKDVYLYRCVTIRGDEIAMYGSDVYSERTNFLNSIKEGSIIDNGKRYTSTASNINNTLDYSTTFNQSYILKIKVPKGTKVLDMRHYKPNVDEFVLPPCSYKVNHIDYNTGIVDCDFIPKSI